MRVRGLCVCVCVCVWGVCVSACVCLCVCAHARARFKIGSLLLALAQSEMAGTACRRYRTTRHWQRLNFAEITTLGDK